MRAVPANWLGALGKDLPHEFIFNLAVAECNSDTVQYSNTPKLLHSGLLVSRTACPPWLSLYAQGRPRQRGALHKNMREGGSARRERDVQINELPSTTNSYRTQWPTERIRGRC